LTGLLITFLVVAGSFERIANVLKVLSLGLLVYVVVAILVTHNWLRVLSNTVVPHLVFDKTYIALLVAVLGTTIPPYLFFWQNAHRIEEMRQEPEGGDDPVQLRRRGGARTKRKLRLSRLDVFVGMAFSNVVMFAIILATGETLHVHHVTSIQSAAQAASALKPFVGHLASAVFALGFIGAGYSRSRCSPLQVPSGLRICSERSGDSRVRFARRPSSTVSLRSGRSEEPC
jgi:Mn2+/Fe2+ NRAMP family transporter